MLTSEYTVTCDTFKTKVKARMHLVKEKRKLLLSISNKKDKKEVSLWREDVELFAEFLMGMASKLDSRL